MAVKKQIIMEKALELFAENGIESTSIQQITQRCGVSKGAFYLEFKSKSELVLGLIDHFMTEIIVDIEQSVNKDSSPKNVLYQLYQSIFISYQKHSKFAEILMREQSSNISNKELFEVFAKYDGSFNLIIASVIRRQFPDLQEEMVPDSVYFIKGLIRTYSELFFIYKYPIDLHLLCESLVEKTTLTTKNSSIHLISEDFLSLNKFEHLEPTRDGLIKVLEQKVKEVSDPIVLESLELLLADLQNPNLPKSVIKGLVRNLYINSHTKWIAYLYDLYLQKN
ncbi:TetR/AcrR family transcriptional regulator [Bacillaceae bacterium S4-13-58]